MQRDANKTPLVSVVIPTHNRAALLEQAIASVYAQEGIGEYFRVEVIVIDDASTDWTSHVMARYPQVRYVRLPTNLGAAGARNAGIRTSSGQYVAFLDDDDLWLPHKLSIQVPVLEANPSIGVVYGHGYTEGDGFSNVIWPDARWGFSGSVFEKFIVQDSADVFNIDTVLVRREAFDKAGYFDQSIKTMEHHDMMLRLAFYFQFKFITGPVTKGRLSKNGLFLTSISEGIYEQSYRKIVEKALALLPEDKESMELRRKARRAVFAIVAELHWQYRCTEQLRSFILRTLKEHPWTLEEPLFLTYVGRLAGKQADDEEWPRPAIRRLWAEVKCAAEVTGIKGHWQLQQLYADLLIEAAIVRIKKGSFKASAGLLLPSVLRDPTRLCSRISKIFIHRFILPSLQAVRFWNPKPLKVRAGTLSRKGFVPQAPAITLSVIIPCLNAAKTIAVQLEALERQHWAEPFEVIVADNGSTDATPSIVRSYIPRMSHLSIIDASETRGAAHAMNRGALLARGAFLVFCDADDEVAPDWLAAMGDALCSHDIVASRMEFHKLNSPLIAESYKYHPQTRGLPKLWYPPYLPHAGTCGLGVRRSLHEAVHGFDESLLQVMDTDYCIRIQRMGSALHFAADAVVHIRCRATPVGAFKQLLVWGEFNMLIYKRYRPSAEYEWGRWNSHLRSWARLMRTMPEWRTPKGRSEWFRRFGWQAGILKGSLKHRVPPVPIP